MQGSFGSKVVTKDKVVWVHPHIQTYMMAESGLQEFLFFCCTQWEVIDVPESVRWKDSVVIKSEGLQWYERSETILLHDTDLFLNSVKWVFWVTFKDGGDWRDICKKVGLQQSSQVWLSLVLLFWHLESYGLLQSLYLPEQLSLLMVWMPYPLP